MVELDTVAVAPEAQRQPEEHGARARTKPLAAKVAFFITPDQLDAMQALEEGHAEALAFKPATWLALVRKGLARLEPQPGLTPAGRAYLAFNRTLEAVNRIRETNGPKAGR